MFRDVDPGQIIATRAAETDLFALTIGPRTDSGCGVICLYPGHPSLDQNEPGVFDAGVIGNQPVLVYPEAMLAPSPQIQHISFGRSLRRRNGMLLLKGSTAFIVAAAGHYRSSAWSTETGSEAGEMFHANDIVAFTSWEAVIEGPGDARYTLFTIDVSADGGSPTRFWSATSMAQKPSIISL